MPSSSGVFLCFNDRESTEVCVPRIVTQLVILLDCLAAASKGLHQPIFQDSGQRHINQTAIMKLPL